MKFQIGDIVSAYRVVGFLGEGSMGEVYEVEHERLHVRRVLKLFAPKTDEEAKLQILKNRFGVEARVLCEITEQKPDEVRLAKVYEYDDSDSSAPYYVMDCIRCADNKSRSLYDAKSDGYEFTQDAVIEWFKDVCRTLAYLHRKNIVHRDIKPKNILLDHEGHAVLADFGTVKILEEEERSRLGVEKSFADRYSRLQFGTREFWAPEIINGKEASPASDCYALAKTFWWLLRDEYIAVGDNLDDWPDGEHDSRWKRILPKMLAPCPENRLVDLDKCLRVFSPRKRRKEKTFRTDESRNVQQYSGVRKTAPLRPFWMWSIVIMIPFMVFWFRRYRYYCDTWIGKHPWYYFGWMWFLSFLLDKIF